MARLKYFLLKVGWVCFALTLEAKFTVCPLGSIISNVETINKHSIEFFSVTGQNSNTFKLVRHCYVKLREPPAFLRSKLCKRQKCCVTLNTMHKLGQSINKVCRERGFTCLRS